MMSSQNGDVSTSMSDGIVYKLLNMLPLSDIPYETMSYIIRKMAHFGEYMILGFLFFINIEDYISHPLIVSLMLSFIYALSDEFHQLFISMRNGSLVDVMIDTSGAFFALMIYRWIRKRC